MPYLPFGGTHAWAGSAWRSTCWPAVKSQRPLFLKPLESISASVAQLFLHWCRRTPAERNLVARLRSLAQYQGKEEQERLEEGLLAEHRLRARIQVGTGFRAQGLRPGACLHVAGPKSTQAGMRSRAGCMHACGLEGAHSGGQKVGCVHACGLAGGFMTSDPARCRDCTCACAPELCQVADAG